MIEPDCYAGATNLLSPKPAGLKAWTDIKGNWGNAAPLPCGDVATERSVSS